MSLLFSAVSLSLSLAKEWASESRWPGPLAPLAQSGLLVEGFELQNVPSHGLKTLIACFVAGRNNNSKGSITCPFSLW